MKTIDLMKHFDKAVENKKKQIIKEAVRLVLFYSPSPNSTIRVGNYTTGFYRSQNLFSVNSKKEKTYTKEELDKQEIISDAEIYSKLESELKGNIKTFYISNSLPYANRVEVTGWGDTKPYLTYSLALNDLKKYVKIIKALSSRKVRK